MLRVACPPFIAPCFYGIDIGSIGELFGPRFMTGQFPTASELKLMAHELGADSLAFLPRDAIAKAIGMSSAGLCQACTTGTYPTPAGQRLYELAVRRRPASSGEPSHRPAAAVIGQKPCNR